MTSFTKSVETMLVWSWFGKRTQNKSNALKAPVKQISSATQITSLSRGSLMRQNVCRALAPSSRAASSTSSGTLASPARKITMKNPDEAQPEITEIVNNARPSFNMPGSTPTPALNKKPNTNPTTTIDNTAGEKNAT